MSRIPTSHGQDSPPKPGLGATATSRTCLARTPDPAPPTAFTASREGCLASHDLFDVWGLSEHSRIGASRKAGPASGRGSWSASSRRALRWSSTSAGVPRKRTCERQSRREPCEDRDASGWVRSAEASRTSGRDARAGWRPRTPWRSEEHRRAGSPSAQRRRERAHAADADAPPGASTPAERPSWRSRSRDPRRPHLAFLGEIRALSRGTARRVVFDLPTTRRALTGSDASGGSPILSFAFPREHERNHLSLADPGRPRVRNDRALFRASGWRPRSLADRLDVESASGPRRGA